MASPPRRRRRGAAAIEFALWINILFVLLSGVADWGYYMNQRVRVARATMDGARMAVSVFEPVNTTSPGSQLVPLAVDRTKLVLGGLGVACDADCVVDVRYCARGAGGNCKKPPFNALLVSTSVKFTPFFGWAKTPARLDERFMMAVLNQ